MKERKLDKEYDTENKIRWVEERRAIPRPA